MKPAMRHTAVVVALTVALSTAAPDVSGTTLDGQHPGTASRSLPATRSGPRASSGSGRSPQTITYPP